MRPLTTQDKIPLRTGSCPRTKWKSIKKKQPDSQQQTGHEETKDAQNEETTEERTEAQNEETTEDGNDYQKCTKSKQKTKKTMDKKEQHKHSKSDYRQCTPGPRYFKIQITRKEWKKIKPNLRHSQLRHPWTDILYDQFYKINPCCTLSFKYQHVKVSSSHKKSVHFLLLEQNAPLMDAINLYF